MIKTRYQKKARNKLDNLNKADKLIVAKYFNRLSNIRYRIIIPNKERYWYWDKNISGKPELDFEKFILKIIDEQAFHYFIDLDKYLKYNVDISLIEENLNNKNWREVNEY